MTQSNFVNPHGLPADQQITSARDMAMLARTVLREFPEYNYYWSLPGIRLGKRIYRNHNNLMGRYEGTDGMKTGFICASGFNVVATATRGGKRLIAVVLGSPSPAVRAVKAAQLFERGFQVRPLSWLTPGIGPGRRAAADQCRSAEPARHDVRQGPPPAAVGRGGERSARATSRRIRPTPCSCRRCAAPAAPMPDRCCRTCGSASRCASITGPPSAPVDQAPAEAKAKARASTKTAKGKKSGERQSHRQQPMRRARRRWRTHRRRRR